MNHDTKDKGAAARRADAIAAPAGKILIVGGYGEVGRAIAARLAPEFSDRVVVAGRSAGKAEDAAAALGHGAAGRALDLFAGDHGPALEGVGLVIVCLDQTGTGFAEDCLARGIRYLDISADYGFLARVEALDGVARQGGGTAILSVGVAPGLTNLLAREAQARMERVERIDILLEAGLGDRHGRGAVEWMFDNLDAAYEVRENGAAKRVRSFGESRGLALPGQSRARPAWRFNFSDQHVIARTLDVPSVSTWVRFNSRAYTWAFARASQWGLGRLLRRGLWRRFAIWLFMNVHLGPDSCGVAVRASGRAKDGGDSVTLGLIGRREAEMTAIAAAETARQALTRELPAGVFHSEQVIDLDPVIAALKRAQPGLVAAL